ncbi:TPM domain-containing protein [Hymenobacter lucidus]|uniref:TPM domain-containing protein n=1 Tax=Hymenobacter lucidus TaxID=2880930 RepID=A0ABS8APR3_9BACT|nr:TPM domain-containing protein [Hymenobacter lucidus]MCB2406731.1 TPM domain-containing protein [Hymenobacter lucidus]
MLLSRCLLIRVLVLLAWFWTSAPAVAQNSYLTTIPDPKTLGQSYVSDPDHLLQPATVQDLNAVLRPLDQAGRAHIDVVLTRSIGQEVPKTAATALFNRWKIGDKEKNNGLLLLLVEDQHRVEFETGYGLEADLPDVICFRIQQRYMVPELRQGRYDAAIRQGVAALIRQLSTGHFELPADSAAALAETPAMALAEEGDFAVESTDPKAWSDSEAFGVIAAVLFLVVLVLVLWFRTGTAKAYHTVLFGGLLLILGVLAATVYFDLPVSPRLLMALSYGWPLLYLHGYLLLINQLLGTRYAGQSRHARYTFLNTAHHGLGFLRFLFPLGLAFYWPWHQRRMAALREAAYACPACTQPMHRLDETQDDAALQPGQFAEEQVESVDYDVWHCAACQHRFTLEYANLGTDVEACEQCHHRTAQPQPDEEMEAATTSHGGWGWHVWYCAFCLHTKKEKYTTARLSSSSGSSSSGSSSSSSGFSSSSGGSSGGGGAGSSW